MRVAMSFPGCHRRGGVERIVYECARFLSRRGHDVNVLASDWEKDPEAEIRYTLVRSIGRPRFLRPPSYYRNASRELKKADYDVLNTHGLECPTGGVHWVQSLHAAWLEQCRQHRRPFTKPWLLQKLNPLHPILLQMERRRFVNRQYTRVIATTPRVKEDMNRFYGVPAEDVVIIPNGFSPDEFNPRRREADRRTRRSKLNLRDDEIALLFAANELERKGYPTLLRAIKILGRNDIRLLVVGRPPVSEVRRLAEEAGVQDLVMACGHSGNIAEFHAAADLFVLPTQYEAYCLAILEALGSGLPVVTTRVPGARDAILPGVNGLTISDPTDCEELAAALATLLDGDVRSRMSDQAPATVAQFQWPRVLESYERVLSENRMTGRNETRAFSGTGESVKCEF